MGTNKIAMLWQDPDPDDSFGESDYDRLLAEQQQTAVLKMQISQFGDESSRRETVLPAGQASGIGSEEVIRSYQLHPAGTKLQKEDKPDPCKRLLKAMKIPMMDQKKKRKHAYEDS